MAPHFVPGTKVIDSSTIDPTTSKWVAEICRKYESVAVDAPVSGGVGGNPFYIFHRKVLKLVH